MCIIIICAFLLESEISSNLVLTFSKYGFYGGRCQHSQKPVILKILIMFYVCVVIRAPKPANLVIFQLAS